MTLPHFVVHEQTCEFCRDTLYIGEEAVLHEGDLYCSDRCLGNHLARLSDSREVFLTDKRIYRSVN